jgi:hypothetical protein
MKKSITLLGMVLSLLILQQCAEDQAPAKPGSIQFALHISASDAEDGRRPANITDANTVLITIRKSTGETVHTRKQINLLNLGGHLVSEPLPLEPGDYEITEFMLAELGYIITFATPLEGSALAEFIDDPLPISFTVNDGAATDLDVEVIDATLEIPEAFGYVTFGVAQAPQPFFKLAVFTPADGKIVLSKAHIYIIEEKKDTVVNRYIDASVNTISLVPKNDTYYELIVIANSYKTFHRSFGMNNIEYLNGEPWAITLEPALTMVTPYINGPFPYNYSFTLNLYPEVTTGTIHVSWGANHDALSVYTLDQVRSGPIMERMTPGTHAISVVRNLGGIEGVLGVEINSNTRDIGLASLTKLFYFTLTSVASPDTIDFSHNPELRQLNLSNTNIRWVDLSNNLFIRNVDLTGATNFSAQALNNIIDHLYQISVTSESWGGTLSIGVTTESDSPIIAPLSAESLQKLRTMHGNGWQINPRVF